MSRNHLNQHVDQVQRTTGKSFDQVNRIAYPLFKNTPLSYFCYERTYDSGEFLCLSTGPDLAVRIIMEDLFPTLAELNLFNTFGMRTTFLSHHMPLPPGAGETNPEKYHKLISCAADENLYHSLFIVDRQSDHYRICGFGVNGNLHSVFNFYLNIMGVLENFIKYFERHADELIESNCQNNLLILPNYHNELVLLDPATDLPINFAGLDFTIDPPSKYITASQRMTQRERDCLELTAQGHTMKTAARKLQISPRTVEQHLRNLKERYHVNTKAQLIEIWHDHYKYREEYSIFSPQQNSERKKL
ncbi:MAG: LuxR C-terminal-related transcriptional regulator [Pseudomonadota bacterium]|nr:LuxR C-terminal-related transcriptional regulator [Pseudomonadota bacterium]